MSFSDFSKIENLKVVNGDLLAMKRVLEKRAIASAAAMQIQLI
jgi:hypothetical protein